MDQEEKEQKTFSRRAVLKGVAAGAAASLLETGCATNPQEKAKSEQPAQTTKEATSSSPTPTAESTSTVTPEKTSAVGIEPSVLPEATSSVSPEAIVFPQTEITPDLVKQGFANIGGPEEIVDLKAIAASETGEEEVVSWQTIEGYTSLAWQEKINLEDLAKDEIKDTKA